MNLQEGVAVVADPQPLQPLQPPRLSTSSTTCDRHPDDNFAGSFCPSCLYERLAVLDPSSSASAAASSSLRKPSAAAASALKSIFRTSDKNAHHNVGNSNNSSVRFFPELRRTKSFSASKGEGFSGVFEPQRKSCDVRGRSNLSCLFNLNDENKHHNIPAAPSTSTANHIATTSTGIRKEDAEQEASEEEEDDENFIRISNCGLDDRVDEIIEEEEEENLMIGEEEIQKQEEELAVNSAAVKSMKDHIDLDSGNKKARDLKKEIAGSLWSAASVFSKKLQKWRRRQKMKKLSNATLPIEKPIGRQFRETQSEIADYGLGRRSCDTDPRFSLDAGRISLDTGRMSLDAGRMSLDAGRMSLDAGKMSLDAGRISLDAGRMSFDDPRYSFDEPRASWDGYLMGRNFLPPRLPPMVAVVEDPLPHPVHVPRTDAHILLEEPPVNFVNISNNSSNNGEESVVPGGSIQTRDFYSDSSSKRRKSFERSNSIRKTAAAVVAEINDMKTVSNAKVTPSSTLDYKLLVGDRELRDVNFNMNSTSLRDDFSETFELGFRDNASVVGSGERKGAQGKKSKRWSKGWSIWGLIHWRSGHKDDDEDRYSRAHGVERSYSESWQDKGAAFNRKVFRSNSSVSWRNSYNMVGSFGSARKSGIELNGHGRKKKDEFVLERNRSARYSPNNVDNGLLRFYLTPMGGSRRGANGKTKPNNSHSVARNSANVLSQRSGP